MRKFSDYRPDTQGDDPGKIREAGIYGLLVDDATDVEVMEQMVALSTLHVQDKK